MPPRAYEKTRSKGPVFRVISGSATKRDTKAALEKNGFATYGATVHADDRLSEDAGRLCERPPADPAPRLGGATRRGDPHRVHDLVRSGLLRPRAFRLETRPSRPQARRPHPSLSASHRLDARREGRSPPPDRRSPLRRRTKTRRRSRPKSRPCRTRRARRRGSLWRSSSRRFPSRRSGTSASWRPTSTTSSSSRGRSGSSAPTCGSSPTRATSSSRTAPGATFCAGCSSSRPIRSSTRTRPGPPGARARGGASSS